MNDQVQELIKQVKQQTPVESVRFSQNVNLLKSISQYPKELSSPKWNHYIEPVEVEFFATKVGKFIQLVKYLFIELYDPVIEKKEHIQVHDHFKKKDRPISIIEIMDTFPEYMVTILEYCGELISFHEKIGIEILNGLEGNNESIIRALYLTEVLRKKEPTLATLEILGSYIHYNLNWYIRYLNRREVSFSLEDDTIYYLMNIYIVEKENRKEPMSERFSQLRKIYIEQAFWDRDGENK